MSKKNWLILSVLPVALSSFFVFSGCFSPQFGVIDPNLTSGLSGIVINLPTPVVATPTPTPGAPVSVVIFAGNISAAPTNANPPVTVLASYSPLQAGKPIAVTVTAQLASSRLGVQLVQSGTTTVLASNLSPTNSTTVVAYTPASTAGVTILVNDTVNPGTLQNIYVQVTQAI